MILTRFLIWLLKFSKSLTLIAFARDNIGILWVTDLNESIGLPPTLIVGESGLENFGYFF